MQDLWNLPTEPGTIIAIGEWWLVRLEPWNGDGPGCWELLPARSEAVKAGMDRAGVRAQCVYGDEWVFAEADQEGGYFIVSEPLHRRYGPHIRYASCTSSCRHTSSDAGNVSGLPTGSPTAAAWVARMVIRRRASASSDPS